MQKPEHRAIERDENSVLTWTRRTWPVLKKAKRQGRLIVFIDESGVSERPPRVRMAVLSYIKRPGLPARNVVLLAKPEAASVCSAIARTRPAPVALVQALHQTKSCASRGPV